MTDRLGQALADLESVAADRCWHIAKGRKDVSEPLYSIAAYCMTGGAAPIIEHGNNLELLVRRVADKLRPTEATP